MEKDNTEELIRQIQATRQQLASSLYKDFFGDSTGSGAGASGSAGENAAPGASQNAGDTASAGDPQSVSGNGYGAPADVASTNAPVQFATGPAPVQTESEPAKEEPEEDPMETLNNLIGLEKIKHDVKELTNFAKIQKARQDAGLRSVPVSLHLVFTGNPGTGKTTVARILAKLYRQIGVLSKGQLVEVDRSGLVAGYVGQTALKTQEQIQKALGGVLFIDEAYALASRTEDFGQEAIDTILKAMEDHRDDLIVIVAGYTEPMERFINSNPGLKSRFNKYIEFPDYTIDELMKIFDLNCKKYDYVIEEETRKHVREKIAAKKLASLENFANARSVRNLFEEIITNQATRIAGMENPTLEDLKKITNDDLIDSEEQNIDARNLVNMMASESGGEEAASLSGGEEAASLSDGEEAASLSGAGADSAERPDSRADASGMDNTSSEQGGSGSVDTESGAENKGSEAENAGSGEAES